MSEGSISSTIYVVNMSLGKVDTLFLKFSSKKGPTFECLQMQV